MVAERVGGMVDLRRKRSNVDVVLEGWIFMETRRIEEIDRLTYLGAIYDAYISQFILRAIPTCLPKRLHYPNIHALHLQLQSNHHKSHQKQHPRPWRPQLNLGSLQDRCTNPLKHQIESYTLQTVASLERSTQLRLSNSRMARDGGNA